MREKTLESFDGTPVVYRTGGRGERWIVLANGYGGTFSAFAELLDILRDRYRLMIWDYRGLHRSGSPDDPRRARIEDHCRDLSLLLEVEGIERMVLAGWSFGVKVALEQYRSRWETVEALVLINGPHARILSRPLARLVGLLSACHPLLSPVAMPLLREAIRSPRSLRAAALCGLVHATSRRPPSRGLHRAAQEFLTMDLAAYLRMVLLADAHDAEEVLPAVRVPVLVISGRRDRIVPPGVVRLQARRIPGAALFEIPDGTHYVPMEFPRLLANRIHGFIQDL